jgi:carboxyl-terminal processing protease
MTPVPDRQPFVQQEICHASLPETTGSPFDPVDSFCQLIVAERAEIAAELGCPVTFAVPPPGKCAARFLVGPASLNAALASATTAAGREPADAPVVWIDRDRNLVAVDGPSISDVGEAFQLLRTAFRTGQVETPAAILRTLRIEIADTYPSFGLRKLDWNTVYSRHEPDLVESGASLPALQRLFADLQDAHTWVRDASSNTRLPYRAWIDPVRAHFTHVPTWSTAWSHGVRAGDEPLDVDRRDWWERSAATPRSRALIAGYRWLAGPVGTERQFHARKPDGWVVEWSETYQPQPWHEPISRRILESGTGYLRIRGWMFTPGWIDALDEALGFLDRCARLLVDLRGNGGGQLIAAQHVRDRFLTAETTIGSVRFSIGNGDLSAPAPIVGTPVVDAPAWHKPVRFLVDRLTYSASEDAILGLGGLPHVQIVGEPTGGGSGRPRTIWLSSNVFASVSTALTFDRNGHCIESNGVPVDIPLPIDLHFRDPVRYPASDILAMADQGW